MGKEPDETGEDRSDQSEPSESPQPSDPSNPFKGEVTKVPESPHDSEPSESSDSEEEEIDPEEWPDGVEGGPVKSFLEHLEDLRWTLIKSVAAILLSMIVCLVAATHLVGILKAPLDAALERLGQERKLVLLKFGTNVLWRIPDQDWPGFKTPDSSETNEVEEAGIKSFRLEPTRVGTNYVFVLQQEENVQVDKTGLPLKSYDPLDPFRIALSIALYGGLGLASPFVFFFLGQFIVPALKKTEKRYVFQGLAIGTVLFIAGVLFCYFVMVKVALYAAVMFAQWMGFTADEWRAGEYIGFVCKFLLGMGLAFEVPVILLTLVRVRIMDYKTLSKFRMYWIIIEMIFASVLTPPDPATMLMMAIPLHVLYEFSVLVAWYWYRKEQKAEAAADGSEA